jgi:hypothetical protein
MVEGAASLRQWPGKGDTLAKLESEETSSIRGAQVLRKQRGMRARMSGAEPPGHAWRVVPGRAVDQIEARRLPLVWLTSGTS